MPTRPRFAGLDGLRAIAVLAVILFHLSPGFLPGGSIGVDVFFVISGFLITGLLVREREVSGRVRLGGFWARRARRLLPALGILVLVCSALAFVVGGNVLVSVGRQIVGAATFSGNWLSIEAGQSYFDEATPELFRNLWSLAVEEQFYLAWPLVVLLLFLVRSRRARVGIVVGIAAVSAVLMAVLLVPGSDPTRVYYGTDTHSFGLAIGAALALLLRDVSKIRRSIRMLLQIAGALAVSGLVAIAFLLPTDAALAYHGGLVAVALLTALAIVGAIVPGSALGKTLDVRPLRWIGERSYGLYLWHWPVFVLVVAVQPAWRRTGASGWLLGGIALVITVVAATLSYRFVEAPIRRDGVGSTVRAWMSALRLPSVPRVAGAAALALLLVATTAGTVGAIITAPGETDTQSVIEKGQRAVDAPAPSDGSPSTPNASPPLPGGDQIDAIGDSVMLASAPELQAGFPGIRIDAAVSRPLTAAPGIVQSLLAAGTLRPVIVIGLGTNGPIQRVVLDQIRTMIGPGHEIVVINVQAPRSWTDGVNSTLSQFAQQYRSVELANWQGAIAGHLNLLAGDQIHPGRSGGVIYTQAIADALQRLAELPPVLGPNDAGLAAAVV